jgi:hypothetical protein
MFPIVRYHPLLLTAMLWLTALGCAPAQWLVYELTFTQEEESVNFSCYKSAYLIVPAQGGRATMVLTTEDGGNFYAVAESSAKYFVAANTTSRKAVFSAASMSGNSQALYTASGHLNRSLLLETPSGMTTLRVAEALDGRLLAADDESDKGPSPDGSLGMIGSAYITGMLREDLTAQATRNFTTLNGATSYIVELLEKYGYTPDVGSVPVQPEVTIQDDSVIDASLFPPLSAEDKAAKN